MKKKLFVGLVALAFTTLSSVSSHAVPINLALNSSRTGTPSPLESDAGWGGGSDKWSIVDGLRSYNSWANGLAFNYGGQRQATIDFGAAVEFNNVILWWHGTSYTPTDVTFSYFDSNTNDWVSMSDVTRNYGACFELGSNSGYSHSDEYLFNEVISNKVRMSFVNTGLAIDGNNMVHGWLYEFEIYNKVDPVPEPATMLLFGTGIAGLAGIRLRKKKQ